MPAKTDRVTVEGRSLAISNIDKILYPNSGLTKGHVIDYYVQISPLLLPHLHNKPVTLRRFPDGIAGTSFYEKQAPRFTPEWVQRFPVPRRERGGIIHYVLINDLPTMVWVANLANLEIHPFLHKIPDIDSPASMVFDLDPGEGIDVLHCARVALLLRDVLKQVGLQSFPKVSGSKGMQLYIPLNSGAIYADTQPFAKALAEFMESRHPAEIVSQMAKRLRRGKVFIDWSQNSDFKTTVSVYSLRAKTDPPYVSVPVEWEELASAVKGGDAGRLCFSPAAALERARRHGDLFERVLTLRQEAPSADALKKRR